MMNTEVARKMAPAAAGQLIGVNRGVNRGIEHGINHNQQ